MTTKPRPSAWKPGQSGNPAGRKPGATPSGKLRAAIAENVPAIIATMTSAALTGDVMAARLLLERVLPPIRPEEAPVPVHLPADGTLTEQGRAVVAAVAAGKLAPTQGATLLAALGTLAKIAEATDLAARVAEMEARISEMTGRPAP